MAKTIKIEEMIIGKAINFSHQEISEIKLWNPIISCKFTI